MDAKAHELDEGTLDRIFNDSVVPVLFGSAVTADNPVVILVGAQPGAGKTAAGRRAIRHVEQPIIRIIGDDLRQFHPHFRTLLDGAPGDMPDGTAQAAGAWVRRSIAHAIDHRISVLVEGTFKDHRVPMETATRFQQAGFAVHVVALAVQPAVSRASIATRYVHDVELNKDARFTSLEAHDVAVAALPTTVEELCRPGVGLVGRLVITTRSHVLLDEYGFPSVGYPEARKIIEEAHHTPLNDEQRKMWAEGVLRALSYFRNHDAHLPEVKALVDALLDDLTSVRLTFLAGHSSEGEQVEDSIVDEDDLDETA